MEIPAPLLEGFKALPESAFNSSNPASPERVALGRMLYFEPRISRDQKISCNSCHDLAKFGVDNLPTSPGFKSQRGDRNSPTTLNAAFHFAQFWDGRAADVEAQASGPVLNPIEMAAPTPEYVSSVLKSMPEYVKAFKKAFPSEADPVSLQNAAIAIAAFERKLATPARWDKYLAGDKSALTDAEKTGFMKFVASGCSGCHNGEIVGGREYRKLGLVKAWPDKSDPGRAKVTSNSSDQLVFKVPSLRNVAKTGPYFHNGSIADLESAIIRMGEYQMGKTLIKEDVDSIVVWLQTLTAPPPALLASAPKLPPSTAATPKPE
jgi:cytochrome c peroxidase